MSLRRINSFFPIAYEKLPRRKSFEQSSLIILQRLLRLSSTLITDDRGMSARTCLCASVHLLSVTKLRLNFGLLPSHMRVTCVPAVSEYPIVVYIVRPFFPSRLLRQTPCLGRVVVTFLRHLIVLARVGTGSTTSTPKSLP